MQSLPAILVLIVLVLALKGQLGGHQNEVLTPPTMASIAIGFPVELEGGSVRNLRTAPAEWPPSVGPKDSANLG